MEIESDMAVFVQILAFISVTVLANEIQAMTCSMGQEPDPQSHNMYRWVIAVPDPCQCTEVRVGSLNTQPPCRPFKVTYYDTFLHSDDAVEIRRWLNCPVCTTSYYTTEGRYQYVFPLPPFDGVTVLDFAAQAPADAIISLSTNGTYKGVKYELVIGHGGNQNTNIRRCTYCPTLKSVSSDGVMSGVEMRRFWLRFEYGRFALGKYQQEAYIEWQDPSYSPVRFMIGMGSWNNVVEWEVYTNCQ